MNNDLKNNRKKIYLDYQATTPLDSRVLEVMLPYMTDIYGNPHSSEHAFGWEANEVIEKAKTQIASFINALDDEIIFTSGATESNNLAIIGTAYAALQSSKKRTILVSSIEHKCVLGAARFTEKLGFNVKKIPVQRDGQINLDVLSQMLDDDTLLVSVMATNNEIGVNEPLTVIGDMCKNNNTIFHVDAAQGAFANLDVIDTQVDLMSLSGHKVYGPKGIGALYISQQSHIKPQPIIFGGGQQDGFRSGTLCPFLVAGIGSAFEIMQKEKDEEAIHDRKLRTILLNGLKDIFPSLVLNGSLENRHPGNLNITLPNVDARQFIFNLQPAIAFSTGSACTSGITEPSHVLRAIGLSTAEADASFRMTVGRYTTEDDVSFVLSHIKRYVEQKKD